jgi:hypothetical protein
MATNSTSDQTPASEPHRLTAASLQDPALTGMTRQQLSELSDVLTPALEVQRERVLRTRRGHERLVAPGTGAKAKLTPAERILSTVLHLRKLATMDLLGQFFGVTAMTISRARSAHSWKHTTPHQRLNRTSPYTSRRRYVPRFRPNPNQGQEDELKICTPY